MSTTVTRTQHSFSLDNVCDEPEQLVMYRLPRYIEIYRAPHHHVPLDLELYIEMALVDCIEQHAPHIRKPLAHQVS
jgi:hypothetical protein